MNEASDSGKPPQLEKTSQSGAGDVGPWLAVLLMLVSIAGISGRERVAAWLLSGEQIGQSGAAFFSWAVFILSCAGLAWGLKHSRSLAQSPIVQVISRFLLAWMNLGIRLIESVLDTFPPTRACVRFIRETGTPALRRAIELVGKACSRIPAICGRWLVIVLTLSCALIASAASGIRRVLQAFPGALAAVLSVFAITLGILRTAMTTGGRALLRPFAMVFQGLKLVLSPGVYFLRFCGNVAAALLRPVLRSTKIALGYISYAAIGAVRIIVRGIAAIFAFSLRLLGRGLTTGGRALLGPVALAFRALKLVLSLGIRFLRFCGNLVVSITGPVLRAIVFALGFISHAAVSAVRIIVRGIARIFALTLRLLGRGLTTGGRALLWPVALAFRVLKSVLSLGLYSLRFCGNLAVSLLRPVLRSIKFVVGYLSQAVISPTSRIRGGQRV